MSNAPPSASPPLQRAPPLPVSLPPSASFNLVHHQHLLHSSTSSSFSQHHHHHHLLPPHNNGTADPNNAANVGQRQTPPPSSRRGRAVSPAACSGSVAPSSSSSVGGGVDESELLGQLSREELVARVRSLEAKNRRLLCENGALTKDVNHHLAALQDAKQAHARLNASVAELRDMCCHLDEERTRARSIAREWQAFGSHMSRVMRHEVTSYSRKLGQLEAKQFELVRENFELKQLCLLLDHATNNSQPDTAQHLLSETQRNTVNNSGVGGASTDPSSAHKVLLSAQILDYIRSLEARCEKLDWDNKRQHSVGGDLHSNADTHDSSPFDALLPPQCPPAVADAMRVLRIAESLENPSSASVASTSAVVTTGPGQRGLAGVGTQPDEERAMADGNSDGADEEEEDEQDSDDSDSGVVDEAAYVEQQKAIVRSLCNAAWRKIEEGPTSVGPVAANTHH